MQNEVTYMPPVYRLQLVRESSEPVLSVINSESATDILRKYYETVDREHFAILMLNTQNEIIGFHTVSIGSLNSAIVTGREVFKAAILANAAGLILSHNHPSGHVEPSPEDIELTRSLIAAGNLLDIKIIDHIIIGENKSYSFIARGLLFPQYTVKESIEIVENQLGGN